MILTMNEYKIHEKRYISFENIQKKKEKKKALESCLETTTDVFDV